MLIRFVFVRDGRPHNQGSCSVGDYVIGRLSDRLYSHLVTVTGCTHFLNSKMRLAPQRLVSELLTTRMGVLCSFILVLFLSGTAVHMGWAGANMTATIAISTLAPMTALVLSLAALIFLTRRCASPPQRRVSELLTPRRLCCSISFIFVRDGRPHGLGGCQYDRIDSRNDCHQLHSLCRLICATHLRFKKAIRFKLKIYVSAHAFQDYQGIFCIY